MLLIELLDDPGLLQNKGDLLPPYNGLLNANQSKFLLPLAGPNAGSSFVQKCYLSFPIFFHRRKAFGTCHVSFIRKVL